MTGAPPCRASLTGKVRAEGLYHSSKALPLEPISD